jgi:hypothetical protein
MGGLRPGFHSGSCSAFGIIILVKLGLIAICKGIYASQTALTELSRSANRVAHMVSGHIKKNA